MQACALEAVGNYVAPGLVAGLKYGRVNKEQTVQQGDHAGLGCRAHIIEHNGELDVGLNVVVIMKRQSVRPHAARTSQSDDVAFVMPTRSRESLPPRRGLAVAVKITRLLLSILLAYNATILRHCVVSDHGRASSSQVSRSQHLAFISWTAKMRSIRSRDAQHAKPKQINMHPTPQRRGL
jgi:hypothetical protein